MVDSHPATILQNRASNERRVAELWMQAQQAGRRPVAILLTERLGDLLASEPVAREACARWPGAFVVWFCAARFAAVVRCFPGVDHVFPVVCLSETIALEPLLRDWTVIDLHLHGKECGDCRQPKLRTQGDPRVTTENYYEHGTLLEAFAKAAGFPVADPVPQLILPSAVHWKVDELALSRRFAVIHCESDEPARNWSADGWAGLAARLTAEHDLDLVEIGGRRSGFLPHGERVHDACGQLSYLESMELIRRAQLFVGIDSGPAHMANGVRTPGVILLGRYRSFDRYVPYNGFYGHGQGGAVLVQHWEESPFLPPRKAHAAVAVTLRGSPEQRVQTSTALSRPPAHDLAVGSPLPAQPRLLRAVRSPESLARGDAHAIVFDPASLATGAACEATAVALSAGGAICFAFDGALAPAEAFGQALRLAVGNDHYLTAWGRPLFIWRGMPLEIAGSPLVIAVQAACRDCGTLEPVWIAVEAGAAGGVGFAVNCNGPTAGARPVVLLWETMPSPEIAPDAGAAIPLRVLDFPREATVPTAPVPSARYPSDGFSIGPGPACGNLDRHRVEPDGSLWMSGWGVLPSPWRRPADALVLFRPSGRGSERVCWEVATSHDARPDVAAYLKDPRLLFCGWNVRVPAACLGGEGPVALALLDRWARVAYVLIPDIRILAPKTLTPLAGPPAAVALC